MSGNPHLRQIAITFFLHRQYPVSCGESRVIQRISNRARNAFESINPTIGELPLLAPRTATRKVSEKENANGQGGQDSINMETMQLHRRIAYSLGKQVRKQIARQGAFFRHTCKVTHHRAQLACSWLKHKGPLNDGIFRDQRRHIKSICYGGA